jgi:hypothetical protein
MNPGCANYAAFLRLLTLRRSAATLKLIQHKVDKSPAPGLLS